MAANGVPSLEVNPPFPDTWSLTQLNTMKFSHKWAISNFSLCKKGVGNVMNSQKFSHKASAIQWNLKLFPGGDRAEDEGYVSVFLCLSSSDVSKVTVKYTLCIIDGMNAKKGILVVDNHTFTTCGEWGFPKFIKRDKLFNETNGLLSNDVLTLFCEIIMVENVVHSSGQYEPIHFKMPDLRMLDDDIGLFLESQKFSDITLNVRGKDVQAHKIILAGRSPVFSAMFEHDMEEQKQNRVVIDDINYEVFIEMLRYMYTDKVNDLHLMANELLAAADKYALNSLKTMCCETLYESLNIENAIDIVILAYLHSADQLRVEEINFICCNANDTMKTDAFESKITLYPQIMLEILRAMSEKYNLDKLNSLKGQKTGSKL